MAQENEIIDTYFTVSTGFYLSVSLFNIERRNKRRVHKLQKIRRKHGFDMEIVTESDYWQTVHSLAECSFTENKYDS